jgi:hypothetical protein
VARVTKTIYSCDRCGKDEDEKTGKIKSVNMQFGSKKGVPHVCEACLTTVTSLFDRYKVSQMLKAGSRRTRPGKTIRRSREVAPL